MFDQRSIQTAQNIGSQFPLSKIERFTILLMLIHCAGVLTAIIDVYQPSSSVGKYLWFLSYLFSFASLVHLHGFNWVVWISRYRFLLVLVLLAAPISVIWSLNPVLTLMRSVHIVGSTIIAIYIGYRVPYKDIIFILDWVFGFVLLGGVVVSIMLPELGQETYEDGVKVWRGLQSNKNAYGFTAAIGLLYFLIRGLYCIGRTRWFYYFMLLFAMLGLVKSQSATSLVSVLFALCVMGLFHLAGKLNLHKINALLLLVGMGCSLALFYFVFDLGDLTGTAGRSADFTGRDVIWANIIEYLSSEPWLGAGYGTLWYWSPASGEAALQHTLFGPSSWTAHTAHNGFLQIASELGLPVAIFAVLFFVQMIIEPIGIFMRRSSAYSLFVIGVMCLYLLGNITEARFLIDRELSWILYVALPIILFRVMEQPLELESQYGGQVESAELNDRAQ